MLFHKLKEIKLRKFPPSDIKLVRKEKLIVFFSIIFNIIYAIIVGIIVYSSTSPSIKFTALIGYGFIAPIAIYSTWIFISHRKLKKWPQTNNPLGGNFTYLVAFFLLGMSIVGWALFWNTGLDLYWTAVAYLFFQLTKDELGTLIIFLVGSSAITPAIDEEFLKSFPSILAFFVVLQRNRTLRQKGKGALGNELVGVIIGIIIGTVFEIIELSLYVLSTIYGGGTLEDVYFQIIVRTGVPIHILGGLMGGYAAGRAERLRFEKGEENLPFGTQVKKFAHRFLPFWLIPVSLHFLWNSSFLWLVLIFILLNNNDVFLLFIEEIVVMVIITVIVYSLMIVFFEKANKAAKATYQCPTTGVYALNKNTPCEPITDNPSPISETKNVNVISTGQEKKCFNCGIMLLMNYRYCTNCGVDTWKDPSFLNLQSRRPKKYLGRFLKLSLFFNVIYTLLAIFFVLALIKILALQAFYLFLVLSPVIIMVCATIILMRMRKKYSGKRNVWAWMLFIFNYIGTMLSFILVGIGFLSIGYVYYLEGDTGVYSISVGIGAFLVIVGFLVFLLLAYVFKKGGAHHMLHYQKYDQFSN